MDREDIWPFTMYILVIVVLFLYQIQEVVDALSFSRQNVNAKAKIIIDRLSKEPKYIHSLRVAPLSGTIVPTVESYSTLTLLEHIHLIMPDIHKKTDFCDEVNSKVKCFIATLGLSLDSSSHDNINKKSGVVSVNCGASQIHFNDDVNYFRQSGVYMNQIKNQLPAFEVGLSYNSLSPLKDALCNAGSFCSYEIINKGDTIQAIRIMDGANRAIFVARKSKSNEFINTNEPTIASLCRRSANIDADGVSKTRVFCKGINYVEYFVPVLVIDGKTVEKIARFYDFFFDAPTTLINDGTSHVAIIGFGKIEENGRAEQSLLFRECLCDNLPAIVNIQHDDDDDDDDDDNGTDHHIAIYVGANDDDFEVAASNCFEGDLFWIHSQYDDRVTDVDSAMRAKLFRFKDIIDIDTGDVVFCLEHEVRSVTHVSFPLKA